MTSSKQHLVAGIVLGTTALFTWPAQAAYIGTLEFLEPSATVMADQTIPVWLRFTLDPASDPLILNSDSGGSPPFGVPVSNVPTDFTFNWFNPDTQLGETLSNGNFSNLSSVRLNTSYVCTGTFTNVCSPAAYQFDFNIAGPDSINFLPDNTAGDVNLQPGQSRDYLFGTFSPVGGAAPAGTYEFFGTELFLEFFGTVVTGETELVLDDDGNPIPLLDNDGNPVLDVEGFPVYETVLRQFQDVNVSLDLASTGCSEGGGEPNCPFTRNVTAVPAPAGVWLLLTGVAGLGWRRFRSGR
jgi:hypothetical protein